MFDDWPPRHDLRTEDEDLTLHELRRRGSLYWEPDPGPERIWWSTYLEQGELQRIYRPSCSTLRQVGYVMWDVDSAYYDSIMRNLMDTVRQYPEIARKEEEETARKRAEMAQSWAKRLRLYTLGKSGRWDSHIAPGSQAP